MGEEWHLCTEGGRVVVGVSMPWEWEMEGAGLGRGDGTVRWCPAWEVGGRGHPVVRKGI
jgi:hypothetical protein